LQSTSAFLLSDHQELTIQKIVDVSTALAEHVRGLDLEKPEDEISRRRSKSSLRNSYLKSPSHGGQLQILIEVR
jgi:hypothetical protein